VPSVCVIAIAGLAALGIATGKGWHSQTAADHATPVQVASNAQQSARVLASMGTLPLAFEANQGQTDRQVKYMARGNGYTVFLTANDADGVQRNMMGRHQLLQLWNAARRDRDDDSSL